MRVLVILLVVFASASCAKQPTPHTKAKIIDVAQFKGQQVTGVTTTNNGRLFANFPRWRVGVKNAVVEVSTTGKTLAYPDNRWNAWEVGQPLSDSLFVAVQSVVAYNDELYVLDTRNPLFGGVLDAPRLFIFDLNLNVLKKVYLLSAQSYKVNSYINDLRVDAKTNCIYMTDSGEAGLVVMHRSTGKNFRVLDNHYSTLAETNHLTINGKQWNNTVHSDGIALHPKTHRLYFHSLTGYNLYSVSSKVLATGNEEQIEADVQLEAKTAAPDGMIFDTEGNLYFADLESNKIQYLNTDHKIQTLCEGKKVRWADTFSIYSGYLYFTNSRIHETSTGIADLVFSINKVKL